MVVGRDAELIRHIGKKSFSQKQKKLQEKGQWEKTLKEELRRTNNDGGFDTLESE